MSRSPPADLPSSIKPPERCPFCNSVSVAPNGSRTKKLETVRLYRCRACGRTFTPGPRVDNLFGIVLCLQRREGVRFETKAPRA
jgi:transcription elongation factor Elf1